MVDLSALTVGQVSSAVRDFAIVGTLVTGVWKTRGIYEAISRFFERTSKHMDVTENGMISIQTSMNTLLTNHLSHIEADLRTLSGRRESHVASLADDVDPLLERPYAVRI
jgi:hypothetical protein